MTSTENRRAPKGGSQQATAGFPLGTAPRTTLHDRIGDVINTAAFRQTLEDGGGDLIEFQASWNTESQGDFNKLSELYRQAILAGEAELAGFGVLVLT